LEVWLTTSAISVTLTSRKSTSKMIRTTCMEASQQEDGAVYQSAKRGVKRPAALMS